MHDADEVRIESDERGFELHIDTVEDGTIRFHIHGCAEQLLSEVVTKIGPWLLEGYRVKREMARTPFDENPPAPEPGESAVDYYKRTGDAEVVLSMADHLRKSRREGG